MFLAWVRAPRFARNVAISLPTFLFDLGLLFVLIRLARLDYLIATVVSFLIANGVSYFLARQLVFAGTRRGLRAGLVYFLVIAALSAFAVTVLMWLSVGVFHFEVILSRIAASAIVGVGGYLLNLLVNFRVAHGQMGAQYFGDIALDAQPDEQAATRRDAFSALSPKPLVRTVIRPDARRYHLD